MTPTSIAIVATIGGVLFSAHADIRSTDPSRADRSWPLAPIYRLTAADR